MKTTQPNQNKIERSWHLIDAKDQILGRLSTKAVNFLMGKNKVDYAPHVDMGDYVVIINAKNVKVTGNKFNQKLYRRHSQYPGGYKELTYKQMVEKDPRLVVNIAIKRMLPENRLRKNRLKRLFVYVGENHPHKEIK